jgi:integrase
MVGGVVMPDTRWLKQQGRAWYAVQETPRDILATVGKRRLIKSLGTRDVHVAIARRHAALAEFQRVFERARKPQAADALLEAAQGWRETLDLYETGAINGSLSAALEVLADEADAIRRERGPEAAASFVGIARGTATPLLHHVDGWLREGGVRGPLTAVTAEQYRTALAEFATWAKAVGVSTVEGVTKAIAGRFVTEAFVTAGVHYLTANKKITGLSAYWRWMRKRVGITGEPWAGQSLVKANRRTGGERPKRPFTENEVAALMSGNADAELADTMRVAALTGMRISEMYRLTVADCADGWFNVRQSKTEAGVRRVPIHSDLAAIVARRRDGKAPDALLFHEAVRALPTHTMAVSQRFIRYRKRVGVHDGDEGARGSRVDFHSFRRWFITRARNAGIDRAVVAAVVGHETGNVTDDVYSRVGDDALKACVQAVRLPAA